MTRTRPLRLTGLLAALLLIGGLLAACDEQPREPQGGGGRNGIDVTLAAGTCWSGAMADADPAHLADLAARFSVGAGLVRSALAGRPAFTLTEPCDGAHHVEVFGTIDVNRVSPQLTSYRQLLRPGLPEYQQVDSIVRRSCMGEALNGAATLTQLPEALVTPALPDGVRVGWAPPSLEQWQHGRRTYACVLVSSKAVRYRYASIFSPSFPTSLRTCIDSTRLVYVDCAQRHDREKIAVIDLRAAVAAKAFPGAKAIRKTKRGKYVAVHPTLLAQLDRACTYILRLVSTTKKLTGIAEINAARWPAPDGSYPVDCEADTEPTKKSLTTTTTVFNRR